MLVGKVGVRKLQLVTDSAGVVGKRGNTIILVSNPKKGELPYKIVYNSILYIWMENTIILVSNPLKVKLPNKIVYNNNP